MENKIKIFKSERFGEIRTAGTSEKPFFCLADICRVLEIKNVSDCKSKLKQDGVVLTEGVSKTTNQYGVTTEQKVMLTFISEQNLYKVIMRSDKPQAEPFQDWVCGEILPSIRKTGGYIHTKESDTEEDIMARALLIAQETLKRRDERIKVLETEREQDKPKVAFANAIEASKSSCLIGELAKILTQNGFKIGQNRLFEWMRTNGYLGTKGERYNIPNQQYVEQGLFELKKGVRSGNDGVMHTTITTKVTGKGQSYFINKFIGEAV